MNRTVNYILLEDESITSLSLQHTIGILRPDYRLVAAKECVGDVLDLLNDDRVDLIITDVCLADCFCFEVLRSIGCTKPLIVYTGYEQFRDSFHGLNLVDFALKPISPEQLEESLSLFEQKCLTPEYHQQKIVI